MSTEYAGPGLHEITDQLDELDFSNVTLGQLRDIKHPVLRQLLDGRITEMMHQSHGSHGSHYSSAGH
jgi:hypothetical protein